MTYLEGRRYFLLAFLFVMPLAADGKRIVLTLLYGNVAEALEEVLIDHLCCEHVLTEPHHATATDCRKCRIAKVLHLKHNAHLQGEMVTLLIW